MNRLRQDGLASSWSAERRLLAVACGGGLLFFYLAGSLGIHPCVDDCKTYTVAMGTHGAGRFSALFHAWRPWAVPAFFATFGSYNPQTVEAIVLTQTLLGFASWIYLAWALGVFLSRVMWVRRAAFALVAPLMLGQAYQRYNQWLASDSLALTALLLLLAVCLHFLEAASHGTMTRTRRNLFTAALLGATAVLVATRDSNLLPAMATGCFLVARGWRYRELRGLLLRCFAGVCVLVLLQLPFAAQRHRYNDEDIFAGWVLPSPELREYFVAHGMPADLADAGSSLTPRDLGDIRNEEVIHARTMLEQAPSIRGFFPHFGAIYRGYLLSHPGLVAGVVTRHAEMIFDQEGPGPTGFATSREDSWQVLRYAARFELPEPRGWAALVVAVVIVFAYAAVWLRSKFHDGSMLRGVSALPLFLMATGALNAILSFFGDVWEPLEMSRHAFLGSIEVRLGVAASVVFVLDYVARWSLNPRRRL